jgi:hypothetical protein
MTRTPLLPLLSATLALFAVGVSLAAHGESIALPRVMPSFNQAYTDGPGAWGNCRLGTGGCPDHIRATGCLITAFSAVLAYYDISLSIPAEYSCTGVAERGMNPRILNDWLRARRGYGQCAQDPSGSCCLEWEDLPHGVSLSFFSNRSSNGLNAVAALVIDHALRQGYPVIAGVHWGTACRSGSSQTEDCHWIVLTGKAGDTYTIMDPYNSDTTSSAGLRTTLDNGSRGSYTIDRFVIVTRTAGDFALANAVVVPGSAESSETAPAVQAEVSQRSPAGTLAVLFIALTLVAAAVFLATGQEP